MSTNTRARAKANQVVSERIRHGLYISTCAPQLPSLGAFVLVVITCGVDGRRAWVQRTRRRNRPTSKYRPHGRGALHVDLASPEADPV
eukprot:scaffold26712_cov124-Isochrysis_galbana.AAC.1